MIIHTLITEKIKTEQVKKEQNFLIADKESHKIKYTPKHKINDMSSQERTWRNVMWEMGCGVECCKCAYYELLMWKQGIKNLKSPYRNN